MRNFAYKLFHALQIKEKNIIYITVISNLLCNRFISLVLHEFVGLMTALRGKLKLYSLVLC